VKATIERSGGVAGIRVRRQVEISREQLRELKKQSNVEPLPDAFTYEVTIGKRSFRVPHSALIERLLSPAV
jgi:hypothetical protein